MSADRLDSLDMLGATLSLPDQLRSALARSQPSVAVAGEFHHVLVCGMGGSGIGGDLAAAITSGTLPVPLLVSKQYELPGYIGNRSLVIASSFSGNSEETVGAARAADEAGATVVVMSSGGKLAEFAAERGCAYYEIDPAIAMPRAGIGAMTVPLLALFEDLGWADSMREQVAATAQHLDGRIEEFRGHDGAPARLARAIGRNRTAGASS